jgi:nucleotide-binding universal stress UspA family protein
MIVAAIDDSPKSEQVINEAATLAAAFDDTVHVIHVISRSEFLQQQAEKVKTTGEGVPPERIRKAAKRVAMDAMPEDVDCEPVGTIGSAQEEIMRYSNENDARYIVLAPRKRSPVGKALFGSVAQHVILNSDRPVVTIKHGKEKQ